MKTPTLIVRLTGLYLLATCSFALFQIHNMPVFAGASAGQHNPVDDYQVFASLGMVAGLVASFFAGPVARLLTFDSEPKGKTVELSDRLLGSNDKKVEP